MDLVDFVGKTTLGLKDSGKKTSKMEKELLLMHQEIKQKENGSKI